MLTIRLTIDSAAAASAGYARQGVVECHLSDEDVAPLDPSERGVLAGMVRDHDAAERAGRTPPYCLVATSGGRCCYQHPWVTGDAAEVLAAIRESTAAVHVADAERDAMAARQRDERVASWLATPVDQMVVRHVGHLDGVLARYVTASWGLHHGCPDDERLAARRDEAAAECRRREAADAAADAAERESTAAAAAARVAERMDWISAHGSAHLRRLVADVGAGLAEPQYQAERLDHDTAALAESHPGWEFERAIPEEMRAPRALPTPEAYELLDVARSHAPDARLVELVGDGDEDEDGDEVVTWAAAANFRGRDIVLRSAT